MANDLFIADQKLGVQNVHLVTGEDIIGTVFYNEADPTKDERPSFIIVKPMIPMMAQDPQSGNLRVGLQPLRPWLDIKELSISADKVIYHINVNEQMAKLYQQFTSDIIIAPAGSVPPTPISLR